MITSNPLLLILEIVCIIIISLIWTVVGVCVLIDYFQKRKVKRNANSV